ncbi:MAG: hypothetical protein KAJ19_26755 [Gammaproteobacteria bacterium]|nr:hypothetical protein [Gammaproteobacteria bacterium]
MGWLSDLFGWGGDDSAGQVITQETTLPGHITDFTKEQLNLARELGGQPYTPYGGDLVQPFSADQLQAQADVRAGQGVWRPGIEQAAGVASEMAGATMNPYLDAVLGQVNKTFDERQLAQNAEAVRSGAFGGDRRGVYDASLDAERAMATGQVSANAYENMMNTRRGGLEALRSTSGDLARMSAGDVAALGTSGAQQQGLGQLGLDVNYQQFLREQEDPTRRFNLRQTAIGNLPYGQAGTTTQPVPQSTWAQNVGAMAAGVGGLGSFFSTPTGGQSAATGLGKAWDTLGGSTGWWGSGS